MNPLAPYMLYIRIALIAIVLGGTAYFSAHWATQIADSKWQKKEAAEAAQALANQQESTRESNRAGTLYEQDRTKVRRVVSTPDWKLNAILQTPVGDIIIPGDLGVRLNAIAMSAEQTGTPTSGPDSGLRSTDPVSDSVSAASGVAVSAGNKYFIGSRLPSETQTPR